jgi:hypothetical protein
LHLRFQCGGEEHYFDTWRGYLPLGLNYLDVFKEKKPKCHYIQNYDLREESIQFQNLKSSTTLVERENLFCIANFFLYNVIPTKVARTLCEEAQWLDLHVDNYKRGPKMGSSKMNMFRWKQNRYKVKSESFGRYYICSFFTC